MQRSEVIKFLILRTIGNFLLLFAIVGILLTFGQALYQETIYRLHLLRGIHFSIVDEIVGEKAQKAETKQEPGGFGTLLTTPAGSDIAITPVDTEFSVVIPKINANSRIIPNVDPGNYDEYMGALTQGVAHAAGSVFPGMDGNVYLFAHSTDYFWNVGRYNAVFYLLKELDKGDEVDIFYGGRRYIYTVEDKRIVNPDDVSFVTNNIGGQQRLTLQTCWPPGTTIKRLIVFAKPKGNS